MNNGPGICRGFSNGGKTMVKVYGYIKHSGLAINDRETKIFIGTYHEENAAKILSDETFISRWNNEHIASIYKVAIEITEEE